MDFLQWLYDYAIKIKPKAAQYYNAFEKRSQAIKKQGITTSPFQHLIPNK